MRIVCQQIILMKSHTSFFLENWERCQNMSSAAVEVCILRVKLTFSEIFNRVMFLFMSKICLLFTAAAAN